MLIPLSALLGLLLGFTLGSAIALAVAAFGAGFSWVYLYGDSPWPEYWALPYILIGLACIAWCGWRGYATGKRMGQRWADQDQNTDVILIWVCCGILLWGASIAGGFYYLFIQEKNQQAKRIDDTQRQLNYCTLLGSFAALKESTFALLSDGSTLAATIRAEGSREGRYTFTLEVKNYLDKVIYTEKRDAVIDAFPQDISMEIPYRELMEGMQQQLGSSQKACEPLHITFFLAPVFTKDEENLRQTAMQGLSVDCPGAFSFEQNQRASMVTADTGMDMCNFGEAFKRYR
jgi:hypothetical protein